MIRLSITNPRNYRYLVQVGLLVRRERRERMSRLGLRPDRACPPRHPAMTTCTHLSLEYTIPRLGFGVEDLRQGWRRQLPNLLEHPQMRALSARSLPILDSLATSLPGQARTVQAYSQMQHQHGKRHRRTFHIHICLRIRHHRSHLAITVIYQAGHP